MTISNETKIGLLAVLGIVLLILGFNFLKGKNIFSQPTRMYAVYKDVLGLTKSNPVVINGMKVGKIADINGGKDFKKMVVTIAFDKQVNIPNNSLSIINPNLLGSPSLEIQLGNSTNYLKDGDTIVSTASGHMLEEAMKEINPVLYEARITVRSMDSVLQLIARTFDVKTQHNIQGIFANLNTVSKSLAENAQSFSIMMDPKTGELVQTARNINAFTANLRSNNQRMDSIIRNINEATSRFASVDIGKTVDSMNIAVNNLKQSLEKLNNGKGTLGKMLNDNGLYENLQSTINKMNILIDDIRVHPKRYVNVSIFGKKDKGNYLTAPMTDDTLKVLK
ncbi:MAG: MCE family protein [Chitinophagaceae bacterium]|nr:MCE family protein [Chitinophagaceae bacterium]